MQYILPTNVEPYRTTKTFTDATIPDGLQKGHITKEGVWGRIVVEEGTLLYALCPPQGLAWLLQPGRPAIIAPGQLHEVKLQGPVRFRVEFYRAPA